jgi:hypothetical protein
MTSVSDTEFTKFLDATNVILAFEDGSSTNMSPTSDINAITFDEGIDPLPKSLWTFNDPQNPDDVYVAIFPGIKDFSMRTDGFNLKMAGKLTCHAREGGKEKITQKTAEMVIAGCNGKCNGIFAFVCYPQDDEKSSTAISQ